jgi:hypothetical protein
MAHVELADTADTEKAAAPDAAPAPTEVEAPETPEVVEKAAPVEENDLTELVKAAVAEAMAPLHAEMAKAMAQPAPGGPVLTRTTEDTTKAAANEAHLTKAAEYRRLAYEVADPTARAGYLQLAAESAAATS